MKFNKVNCDWWNFTTINIKIIEIISICVMSSRHIWTNTKIQRKITLDYKNHITFTWVFNESKHLGETRSTVKNEFRHIFSTLLSIIVAVVAGLNAPLNAGHNLTLRRWNSKSEMHCKNWTKTVYHVNCFSFDFLSFKNYHATQNSQSDSVFACVKLISHVGKRKCSFWFE